MVVEFVPGSGDGIFCIGRVMSAFHGAVVIGNGVQVVDLISGGSLGEVAHVHSIEREIDGGGDFTIPKSVVGKSLQVDQ